MKVAIGSDHAGFELKEKIKKVLEQLHISFDDLGAADGTSVDYPDYARKVAEAVQHGARGILCCGTGIGMAITANKFKGIRAALVHDEYTAKMSREHNDANVLVMGGRTFNDYPNLTGIVKAWLETDFEGGRHSRRIEKIAEFENR